MPKHRIPRAQLIAIAESFAGVSSFADACYRYYFYECRASHKKLLASLALEFADELKAIDPKYHQAVISTALLELSYPRKNPERPAFPAKERAFCMGISRGCYYRIGANTAIDNIINHITAIAYTVADKVRTQLGKNKFKIGY